MVAQALMAAQLKPQAAVIHLQLARHKETTAALIAAPLRLTVVEVAVVRLL